MRIWGSLHLRTVLRRAGSALVMLAVFTPVAEAHKPNVFAHVENNAVMVEAYFRGGGKLRHCDILVYGPGDRLLLKTKTDDQGRARFVPEAVGDLKIVADAGDGHRAEYVLKADDLAGTELEKKSPAADGTDARDEVAAKKRREAADDASAGSESEQLRGEMARMRSSLDTMRRELAEVRKTSDRISAGDVLAGLAFIMALASLTAVLLARRESRRRRPAQSSREEEKPEGEPAP